MSDNLQVTENETRSPGYYLGLAAKIVLAVAMLLYLGMHSYNFFTFTFKGDQWIFAILGLFTTSIGFLLWLAVYMYASEDGLERAVAIVMMFVSLGGEFAVAGFDMYMNISGNFETTTWTAEDLRNMSYIIAGLALLNGLALVADIAGKRIMADLSNVKFPSLGRKSRQSNVNTVSPVTVLAAETEQSPDELIADDRKMVKDALWQRPTQEPTREERPAETPFPSNGQER